MNTPYHNSCKRAVEWEPRQERPMMIKAAWETVSKYYIEGQINAELRDELYKILNRQDEDRIRS